MEARRMKAEDATQAHYPWRAALRTAGVSLLVLLPMLGIVVPEVVQIILDEVGQRTTVPRWARVTLLGVAAAASCVAAIVNRVALIPQVNSFLTRHKLGPVPKEELR